MRQDKDTAEVGLSCPMAISMMGTTGRAAATESGFTCSRTDQGTTGSTAVASAVGVASSSIRMDLCTRATGANT